MKQDFQVNDRVASWILRYSQFVDPERVVTKGVVTAYDPEQCVYTVDFEDGTERLVMASQIFHDPAPELT